MDSAISRKISIYRELSLLADRLNEDDAKLVRSAMTVMFLELIKAGIRPLDIFGIKINRV